MDNNDIIKLGRILCAGGIGTLIGLLSTGNGALEKFGFIIFLAIVAVVGGFTIILITKNKTKIDELNDKSEKKLRKVCPNCKLQLSENCKVCPRCKTTVEKKEEY